MKDTLTEPADPTLRQVLRHLEGNRDGLLWLEKNRPGLACFFRALDGGPKAREKLRELARNHWDEIFELIASDESESHLERRHADIVCLYRAVKGSEADLEQLRRHRPSYALVAGIVRDANDREWSESNGHSGDGRMDGAEAADVGCLIGEMHLNRGEFLRAIEAFTRAIENQPTPDALEGRARAYHALAALDETHALSLRESQ